MAILTKNGQLLTSNGNILTANVSGGGSSNLQSSKSYTVSASGSQTISPDNGYDGMETVALSVPAGTAGTPTATKGTVSSNSISVTPSVTNTGGWISSGTKNGTAVTVSASELVSGNKSITSNGTAIDVTNYATVSVSVGSSVNVQESKSYTVSASGSQTISPDNTYDAMSEVALSVPAQTLPTSTSASATSGYTSKATVSRSTSDQYINIPTGFNNSGAYYKVNAVSNMTLPTSASGTSSGTSKATISRSTSDQYINIPTGYNDTASYYKVNAVANGSVTSPATISGSSASVSTGTNTITLSKTVSVTPTVSTAGYVSSGTAGNSAVSLTASVTTKAAATYNTSSTDQTIASGTYLTGTQTIKAVTTTNLIAANIKKNVVIEVGDSNDSDRIISVTGSYEGSGGGSNLQVGTATTTPSSASSSISFTSLSGEPTSFVVTSASDLATGSSPWKTASVVYDGTNVIGQVITNTSNAQVTYDSSGFSKSYSNGTLTITGTSTNFQANQYKLVYTYGGSSGNIGTDDVQVGSGATSITFTGLSDEPSYFSCIFKSNFSTSSGYQRVITVVYDGTSTYGLAMDSGAKAATNWSYTYNNGSLTISSSGTNAGGYFHQPGYYQLTYATGEVIELTTEPLSVTSNGTYTAPKGKAYTPVTVNVSGGGGANFGTVTTTNSSNQNTTISFTLPSGRTPKAFFVRLTSQIARSSNSKYYYVYDMRWDGSSNGGVAGNTFYMSSGTLTNVTSGYSYSQSGTTFTLSSTGSRSASPGSFYNGTYEMVYVY